MCIDMIVNGKYISTLGELVKELGGDPVISSDMLFNTEAPLKPTTCLCCVDAGSTAEKFGMRVIFHKINKSYHGEVELRKERRRS